MHQPALTEWYIRAKGKTAPWTGFRREDWSVGDVRTFCWIGRRQYENYRTICGWRLDPQRYENVDYKRAAGSGLHVTIQD